MSAGLHLAVREELDNPQPGVGPAAALGARRWQLTADATGQLNQVRDLLECASPAVLEAAGKPFLAATWCAAVTVALDRGTGDLARRAVSARPGSGPRSAVSCLAETARLAG